MSPETLFNEIEKELMQGRKVKFTVTGMSMWPFICHARDQVIVESCVPEDLRVGDIILFRSPLTGYMLHRVTALRENEFETTGDGNCFRDGWFPDEFIKAKVISIIRKGKTIDCGRPWWRFLTFIWMAAFPIRGILLLTLKRIGHWKARYKNG